MDSARLAAVARAHGVDLLVEFGSSVSGATHPGSDLDIGVLLAHPTGSLDEHADLAADLQALEPSREVDVAILNRADPLFLKQVMSRARLLYGTPRRLAELQIHAFRRYQDHRRFLEMERGCVLDPDFARQIARAAGLRHRLVHDYEELDHAKVFDALVDAVRDVPRYFEAVNRHLETLESNAS